MGSGICITYAPDMFSHDDKTKAVVVGPTGNPRESILIAVKACLTGLDRAVRSR